MRFNILATIDNNTTTTWYEYGVMCKVIDDIYKVQGWTDTQPLDLESLKLILAALFIAPP